MCVCECAGDPLLLSGVQIDQIFRFYLRMPLLLLPSAVRKGSYLKPLPVVVIQRYSASILTCDNHTVCPTGSRVPLAAITLGSSNNRGHYGDGDASSPTSADFTTKAQVHTFLFIASDAGSDSRLGVDSTPEWADADELEAEAVGGDRRRKVLECVGRPQAADLVEIPLEDRVHLGI